MFNFKIRILARVLEKEQVEDVRKLIELSLKK